ncbi:MAG: hypothetical protein ACR2JC_01245 [Chloroflexota bacterium]|nr:MAG: hypothetical protein DLM70_10665 [Chloroflexota bacterium]
MPAAVAPRRAAPRPDSTIYHLASWNSGILLHAPDEQILSAALAHDLALVAYDVSTIPPILHRWAAAGHSLPSVVLVIAIPQRDIGSLARGLAYLLRHPEQFDPPYPVVYLAPVHE